MRTNHEQPGLVQWKTRLPDEFESAAQMMEHSAELERLVRKRVSNTADLDEVIQDAIIDAWQWCTIEHRPMPRGLLLTILKRRAYDMGRRRKLEQARQEKLLRELGLSRDFCVSEQG